jgi:hypothetical protein
MKVINNSQRKIKTPNDNNDQSEAIKNDPECSTKKFWQKKWLPDHRWQNMLENRLQTTIRKKVLCSKVESKCQQLKQIQKLRQTWQEV